MMYLLQTVYPVALASVNVAVGWFLYQFESVFGGLLVVVGLLVILALAGDTLGEYTPVLGRSP